MCRWVPLQNAFVCVVGLSCKWYEVSCSSWKLLPYLLDSVTYQGVLVLRETSCNFAQCVGLVGWMFLLLKFEPPLACNYLHFKACFTATQSGNNQDGILCVYLPELDISFPPIFVAVPAGLLFLRQWMHLSWCLFVACPFLQYFLKSHFSMQSECISIPIHLVICKRVSFLVYFSLKNGQGILNMVLKYLEHKTFWKYKVQISC